MSNFGPPRFGARPGGKTPGHDPLFVYDTGPSGAFGNFITYPSASIFPSADLIMRTPTPLEPQTVRLNATSRFVIAVGGRLLRDVLQLVSNSLFGATGVKIGDQPGRVAHHLAFPGSRPRTVSFSRPGVSVGVVSQSLTVGVSRRKVAV